MASLAATAAGAVAVGLVFSHGAVQLPHSAKIAGFVALCLLTASLGSYSAASIYFGNQKGDEPIGDTIFRTSKTIRLLSRLGGGLALGALLALLYMAFEVVFTQGSEPTSVRVSVDSTALTIISPVCPDLPNPFSGSLEYAGEDNLRVVVSAQDCDGTLEDVDVSLLLPYGQTTLVLVEQTGD